MADSMSLGGAELFIFGVMRSSEKPLGLVARSTWLSYDDTDNPGERSDIVDI